MFASDTVGTDTEKLVWIDTNGPYKGPNRLGHDLFVFEITADGRFLPVGMRGTLLNSAAALSGLQFTDDGTPDDNDSLGCNKDDISHLQGFTCTDNAMYDKDYFKNLPK